MRTMTTAVALAALTLACGSTGPTQSTPAAAGGPPPIDATLQVELTINGAPSGSFSCDRGLFLQASARNAAVRPVQLRRFDVHFAPTVGSCRAMVADLDPTLALRLEPGATGEVRRFDATGQLCEPPAGGSGCGWNVTARVTTDTGAVAEDHVTFTTYRAPANCDGVVAGVVTPREGDVLSGVVDVVGGVAEGGGCVNSARGIVEGYSEEGRLVFTTPPLDLGDRYRWDTRLVPNGRYLLTAYQNCCRIRGIPITVSVRN